MAVFFFFLGNFVFPSWTILIMFICGVVILAHLLWSFLTYNLCPLPVHIFIPTNIYQKQRTFTKYVFFFQHWESWNQGFRRELPHVVGFHILRIDFKQLISLHFMNPQIMHIIYPLATNISLLYILLSVTRSQFFLSFCFSVCVSCACSVCQHH